MAADDVGWAGRVMAWLRVVTYVVGVNVLLLLGTLAGGVVAGLFPALGAAGRLLARLGDEPPRVWATFWADWRRDFCRLNRLGAPLWGAAAVLAADGVAMGYADGATRAAFGAVLAVFAAYFLVVLAWFAPATRHHDVSFVRTWRFLLAAPLVWPGTSLAMLVTVAAAVVISIAAPVLVPLATPALALAGTGLLADPKVRPAE